MFSILDIVGLLSNALYAIASGFKNITFLRLALILAALMEIIYNSFIAEHILWTPVLWSIAVIAINIYQILRVIYQKKFLNLTDDELKAFIMIGDKMDVLNFKKFIRSGNWENYKEYQNIVTENKASDKVFFVVEGEAEVKINDKKISSVRKGSFIGEMSFVTGDLPSANVFALADSKLVSWEKEKLKKMMDKNHVLKHEVHFLFSSDIISKLNHQNKQNIF